MRQSREALNGITQSYLRDCFDYDAVKAQLIWKTRPSHHYKNANAAKAMAARQTGKVAGTFDKSKKTWFVKLDAKRYPLIRLIWIYHNGDIPAGHSIVHKGYRDCIENLRLVTDHEAKANHTRMKEYKQEFLASLGLA